MASIVAGNAECLILNFTASEVGTIRGLGDILFIVQDRTTPACLSIMVYSG